MNQIFDLYLLMHNFVSVSKLLFVHPVQGN
jgi:hypothetical protein